MLPHLPDHSSSSANSHLAPGAASMPQGHHRAFLHSPRSQLSSPHTLDQTAYAYAHRPPHPHSPPQVPASTAPQTSPQSVSPYHSWVSHDKTVPPLLLLRERKSSPAIPP